MSSAQLNLILLVLLCAVFMTGTSAVAIGAENLNSAKSVGKAVPNSHTGLDREVRASMEAAPYVDRNAWRMSFGKRDPANEKLMSQGAFMDRNSFRMSFGKRTQHFQRPSSQEQFFQRPSSQEQFTMQNSNVPIPLLYDLGGEDMVMPRFAGPMPAPEADMYGPPMNGIDSGRMPYEQKFWASAPAQRLWQQKRLDRNLYNIGFGRRR